MPKGAQDYFEKAGRPYKIQKTSPKNTAKNTQTSRNPANQHCNPSSKNHGGAAVSR